MSSLQFYIINLNPAGKEWEAAFNFPSCDYKVESCSAQQPVEITAWIGRNKQTNAFLSSSIGLDLCSWAGSSLLSQVFCLLMSCHRCKYFRWDAGYHGPGNTTRVAKYDKYKI